MAQSRSPLTRHHSTASRKPYRLRHTPSTKSAALRYARAPLSARSSGASTSPPSDSEPPRSVLGPLQPNLRRLPSRLRLQESRMRYVSASADEGAKVGTKRKRLPSGSENANGMGRSARGMKRQRSHQEYTDDDEAVSEMEVDGQAHWQVSHDSEDEDEEADDSSDEHLINEAQPRQLLRLRKDELVRLYESTGLSGDAEILTKPEIVDAIIAAREDLVSLPPSSPPRGDGNSSEYSSDDGNVAGDESTHFSNGFGHPRNAGNGLRRRVTVHDLSRSPTKFAASRSMSMGQINTSFSTGRLASTSKKSGSKALALAELESPLDMNGGYFTRRRTRSSHSQSPTGSGSTQLPSPPITRQRTRKISGDPGLSTRKAATVVNKGKGKAKQVEFSNEVKVNGVPSSSSIDADPADESELTDLADLEEEAANPSPRRLRSKGEKEPGTRRQRDLEDEVEAENAGRRKTPMRKAKGKVGSMQESDIEEEARWDRAGEEVGEDEDEEEVDELVSSPSPTPSTSQPGRRTPVRKRLRPRRPHLLTPPSDGDGDDEQEQEEEGEEAEDEVEEGEEAEEEVDDLDDEGTVVDVTPKKLRSGKIVGEEDIDEEDIEEEEVEDEDEEVVEEAEEDADDAEDADGEEVDEDEEVEEQEEDGDVEVDLDEADVDAEGEVDEEGGEEDEVMDDDIDLTVATAKALVRLRRDDLVRMCETRDIDVAGTKPQLAEALLQWRDQQGSGSSPSSTGTARPPSTARPPARGRRRSSRNSDPSRTPPVLLRSHHMHMDEPRTPPISGSDAASLKIGAVGAREGDDGELELDLESLGLEDREIPPEKLTKLEKIGSGGFKDVFIGKFKGRKVAIAEFRGQLTAMDIKELKLLGGFNHPNIVRFLGVSIPENTKETPVMIVSELCSNGDLFDYVRNVQPPSLYKVLSIMLDIARGLEYLHLRKPSVIHRDCKSSNILITSRGTAKIADFGLAKVKQSTRSMVRSLVGTVNWQAPELWHAHPKYNHKVDVFSCGMVFWEMLQWHLHNKKFPWEGMNEHAIYDLVGAKRQRPSIHGLRKQWCPEVVDLMERMWAQEHPDRPTMSEVVVELEVLVQQYR